MRTILALMACLVLVACDSGSELFEPSFNKTAGNPHFATDATGCVIGTSAANCSFKLTGLGKNASATIALTAAASVVYSCANPNGMITRGHTDKVSIGGASGFFSSAKNGSIQGSIGAPITWTQIPQALCPTGHTLVQGSVVTQTSWTLRATGSNQGGTFSVTLGS